MKNVEKADRNNSYSNFWNFVSITIVFLGLDHFLLFTFKNIIIVGLIQFVLIILLYQYVNPYLGIVIKKICTRTKIPIGVFTFIYFTLFIVIRVVTS